MAEIFLRCCSLKCMFFYVDQKSKMVTRVPQDMGSYKKFNKIILSEFTNLTEPNSHWIAPYKANIIFVLIENTRWPPQVDIL